jgi:hypothetical protein
MPLPAQQTEFDHRLKRLIAEMWKYFLGRDGRHHYFSEKALKKAYFRARKLDSQRESNFPVSRLLIFAKNLVGLDQMT